MALPVHRNKSASAHSFAMVPRADIPRSSFRMEKALKTTFDAAFLVPILCEEVLPGDSFRGNATVFCRLATPIVPAMDNLHFETFFFFVPNRLLWTNWKRFMGEQDTPGASISFSIPQMVSPVGGYAINSLQDYFGLPTAGQVGGAATVTHSSLPLRAYGAIFNAWFRDQNMNSTYSGFGVPLGDGPDLYTDYLMVKRGKRHDYFTSALPWVQKGNTSVSLPLGTSAPVYGDGKTLGIYQGSTNAGMVSAAGGALEAHAAMYNTNVGTALAGTAINSVSWGVVPKPLVSGLYADLSTATAATINQLRQAFQIQKLLERDARGGTRYIELIRAHFGVVSPDARQQRPEFIGGGHSNVSLTAIAQQSATGVTGSTSPLASLSAVGTVTGHGHNFSYSATEHGYIIGLANVRADLTYQQGLRKHWSRLTRYDFYTPEFAMLGEQSILNKEIYCKGDANDNLTFGYQERWGELRYNPSEITGRFRSTAATPLDIWHYAQNFGALPALNLTFIEDPSNTTVARNTAAGAAANGSQFICDIFYDIRVARPLPLYSVPGLIDHF